MLIRKIKARHEILDNLEMISQSSGIPGYKVMTACKTTGLFFLSGDQINSGRITSVNIQYIEELSIYLGIPPKRLFSICIETGLFPIKIPSKTILTFRC